MAIVSSHTLNAVDGSHAGGIPVRLVNRATGDVVFDTTMDEHGRLSQEVTPSGAGTRYEMVFHTGPYWDARVDQTHGTRISDEIVIRFAMPSSTGRYHIPLILSPHGYSLWSSTEHG